jgi:hypothetical protein
MAWGGQCLQFLQSLWNAAQIGREFPAWFSGNGHVDSTDGKKAWCGCCGAKVGLFEAHWSDRLAVPLYHSTMSEVANRNWKHICACMFKCKRCAHSHIPKFHPEKPPLPMLVVPSRSHPVRQIDSHQWKEIYLSNVHTSICTNHILHRHQLISRKEASKIHIHVRNVTSAHLIWLLYSLH